MNIQLLVSVVILSTTVFSQPIDLSLEWTTNNNIPFLTELENTIEDEVAVLPTVKGIIVIYKGQVVLENYYNGSSVDDVYNIWSVTKSFISTLVGQAVDMGMMDDPDSSASNFFPDYDIDYVESIKLHHLLGMSSGYLEDWGFLSNSTEEILSGEANGPGTFFYNNNACHLNAHALYYGTGQTPHEFASTYLFPYLGIENPPWSDGYLDINNGSYGLQLNLRDMVKLGQLYIQDGFSGNEQVLSTEWIERATSPQVDTNWGNYGYGYLWWLPQIGLSYQANGAGGQLISVFPDYDLVVGTHSDGDSQALQAAIQYQIAPLFDRPSVAINEILASNNGCCYDDHGENDHYIELYNFGSDTLDVAGFFLTNDANDHDSYAQIQTGSDSTNIAPGEFLLIWSDGSPSQGILHLDALLSNTGGELGLYTQDTTTIIDIMAYSVQAPDMAYAREEDGSGDWVYMNPTPGLSNATIMDTPCDLGVVYVSEAHASGDSEDYIELYNSGDIDCSLEGFRLDNSEDLEDLTFGAVIVPAGGYWVGYENQDSSFTSALSDSGDIIVFADPGNNSLIVTLEELQESDGIELSQSFDANGFGCYTEPTPGAVNGDCITLRNDENLLLPKRLALHQNYPNPFNPTTNISYDLFEGASVDVHILDISGRMVKKLVSGYHKVGNYSVQWDAKDDKGQTVSAGVYIYSFHVNNLILNKKMVLLK